PRSRVLAVAAASRSGAQYLRHRDERSMPREIWLGPILNHNRERLVARCRDLVRAGRAREFVYLAATKPLMDAVSASLLDGDVAGTIDPLNVFLLSGFSRRLLSRARFTDTGELLPYFAAIDTDLR